MKRPQPVILDISEHQEPAQLDYRQLARAIDWVIVRVQYGSRYEDRHYRTHLERFRQLAIPVNVYAWVRGINERDMRQEASDFYRRAAEFQPHFWWLDIEERSMAQMAKGCEVYRQRLKELGAQKVGAYIANHRYHEFGFNPGMTQPYNGVWLPAYGDNNGYYSGANPTATSAYDLHQYTSNARLPGYDGPLDLSRLARKSPADFTGGKPVITDSYRLGETVDISGIYVSSTSVIKLRPSHSYGKITTIIKGAANPYLLDEGMGWVNPQVMSRQGRRRYQVKAGETLSGIANQLGVSWQALAEENQLANPHLIYPGQWLDY